MVSGDASRPLLVHRFALLSGIGWLLDFSVFNMLAWAGLNLFAANVIGATTGVTWVFVTARKFIFRSRVTSLRAAIIGYAAWNVVGILLASAAIEVIGHGLAQPGGLPRLAEVAPWFAGIIDPRRLAAPLAKILVTPFTMYANFVMMGLITERRLSFR